VYKSMPDWYRLVKLQPDSETLNKRTAAIEKYHKSLSSQTILNLVKLIFDPSLVEKSFIEELGNIFRETDDVFPLIKNTLELQVLSTVTLASFLEKEPSDLADIAAYSLVCAYWQTSHKVPVPDLLTIAENYLRDEALRVRETDQAVTVRAPKIELEDTSYAENDKKLIELTSKVVNSINSANKSIKKNFDKLMEESNILWWLLGEYSNDLMTKLSDLQPFSVCIVAAKELADLTRFIPGSISAKHILEKAIQSSLRDVDEILLKDAINSCDPQWKENFRKQSNDKIEPMMHPVIFGLIKSLDTNGKDAWLTAFSKESGRKKKLSVKPIAISDQLYRECLLLRCLVDI